MSIQLTLHKTHRRFTGGIETVIVEGRTVGECLQHVILQFPGLSDVLFDKKGKLNHLVEIYVNMESAYPDELSKPVVPGDEIHVTLLLSGG